MELRSKDAGNNETLLSEQCLKFAIGHQNGLVVLQTKSKNEKAVQKGREITTRLRQVKVLFESNVRDFLNRSANRA